MEIHPFSIFEDGFILWVDSGRVTRIPSGIQRIVVPIIQLIGRFLRPKRAPTLKHFVGELPCITTVQLCASYTCNLGCRYCSAESFRNKKIKTEIPSEELVRRSVDFLLENSPPTQACGIFFSAVEPLVSLDLFDYLNTYVESRRQETGRTIYTFIGGSNGTMMEQQVLGRALAANDHALNVSIDGPGEIHDTNRPFASGRGSYDRIAGFARELIAISPNGARAQATLCGDRPHVKQIFLHLFELGFRHITIKPVRTSPDKPFAITRANVEQVKEAYCDFVRFLLAQDEDSLLAYLSALTEQDFFGRFIFRVMFNDRLSYRCQAGRDHISVDLKGDIYPCMMFNEMPEYKIGNIYEDIDEGKRRCFLVPDVDHKPVCQNCWARYFCGGGCHFSAWAANGNTQIPDAVKCELIRHLTELSIYLVSELRSRNETILLQLSVIKYPY